MVLLRNICYEIVQYIFGMDISSVEHWWHCWVWGAYCATKQTIKKKNLIAHNLKIEKVSNKEIIQVKLLRKLFDCGLKTNFSFVEHSGFEENGWSVWEFIEYLWKISAFSSEYCMTMVLEGWVKELWCFHLGFPGFSWNHVLQFVLTLIVRSCFIVRANTLQELLANS